MFIQDGIYRSVKLKPSVTLPIAEGTVLTVAGTLANADGSDAFGLVPENIYNLSPGGMIRVAVAGTIDLHDPKNAGVSITKTLQLALTGINFIPEPQPDKELPEVSASDNGKILLVADGAWTAGGDTAIASAVGDWLDDHPEATTTVEDGAVTNEKLAQSGGILSEMEDIRTGLDQTEYNSAGDAVRGQVGSLKSAIDRSLWTKTNGAYVKDGTYVDTKGSVGSTVDVDDRTSSTSYYYCILPCHAGDKFHVVGVGGDGPRQWCLTDGDYKILSHAAKNASTAVDLTAAADGYLILNANKNYSYSVEQTLIMDCASEITGLKETVAPMENGAIATVKTLTSLSNRYLDDNGTPSETTTTSWKLFIADINGVDSVRIKTYKNTTSSLLVWSMSSVPFADATVSALNDGTKVLKIGGKTSESGVIEELVDVPATAKTLMVACALSYIDDYDTCTLYKFNRFDFLQSVPSIVAQKSKIDALNVFSNSDYYRDVRWGCPQFSDYYHSVDDGTSLFPSTTTAAEYFAAFNELVSSYTGYAASHEMGVASDETTTMYYYTFSPKTNQDDESYKRPKIIITAGQHGFEKTANFGLYWFAKNLLEDWDDSPFLSYVRNHVELIIMPLLNPYGFDHDSYLNANGVNLNRNWGTSGWSEGTEGTTSYGGSEPFSEVETQYARDVILANLDAIWLCDYHNNGQVAPDSAAGYLWHSFALVTYDDPYFAKAIQAAKWHIDEISGHLYKDYPSNCTYANSGTFTDNNAPSHQGLVVAYAREHDIMAATMEGGAAFIDSGTRFSSPIHHMNADLIGNWIRCILATYAHYSE